MPRRKKGLQKKEKEEPDTKPPPQESVESLLEWTKSHQRVEKKKGPEGVVGDLGAKTKADFDAFIHSEMPDLNNRVRNVEKEFRKQRKEEHSIKFMVVLYARELEIYGHTCDYKRCLKEADWVAVVLADVRENREKINEHYDHWIVPPSPYLGGSTLDWVYPEDLRHRPLEFRTKEKYICTYHARDENVRVVFPLFKRNGLNSVVTDHTTMDCSKPAK